MIKARAEDLLAAGTTRPAIETFLSADAKIQQVQEPVENGKEDLSKWSRLRAEHLAEFVHTEQQLVKMSQRTQLNSIRFFFLTSTRFSLNSEIKTRRAFSRRFH